MFPCPKTSVESKDVDGGTAPHRIRSKIKEYKLQLKLMKEKVKELTGRLTGE